MGDRMPIIQSYHRSYSVDDKTLEVAADDWYPDDELLSQLGRLCGAKTIGDIVETVESGVFESIPKKTDTGIKTARIVDGVRNRSQCTPLDSTALI